MLVGGDRLVITRIDQVPKCGGFRSDSEIHRLEPELSNDAAYVADISIRASRINVEEDSRLLRTSEFLEGLP